MEQNSPASAAAIWWWQIELNTVWVGPTVQVTGGDVVFETGQFLATCTRMLQHCYCKCLEMPCSEHVIFRQNYQEWCIQQCFLPQPATQGGCGGSAYALCSTLLMAVLACRQVEKVRVKQPSAPRKELRNSNVMCWCLVCFFDLFIFQLDQTRIPTVETMVRGNVGMAGQTGYYYCR